MAIGRKWSTGSRFNNRNFRLRNGESETVIIKPASLHPWQVSSEPNADWVERELLPENRVTADFSGVFLHPLVRETANLLKKEKGDGWLVPPHGLLNLRVSRQQLPRALAIMDALLRACESRGWEVSVEVPLPRRRNSIGTFWHPAHGWTYQMPQDRKAETGVVIRREFIAFSLVESGRQEPPTEADIRAWRKQFPYGYGGPPPRSAPNRELVLEIASHPWVSTRRRFRDSTKKTLEDQLNAVIVAFVRMAAGLRNHALKEAIEERKRRLVARRRRDEELRQKKLEENIAHLESGIERWRWRGRARDFLAFARAEATSRNLNQHDFADWCDWAERYVEDRGLESFFSRWR